MNDGMTSPGWQGGASRGSATTPCCLPARTAGVQRSRSIPTSALSGWRTAATYCKKVLPVDVTDDEVYRYLPAVLVGTVDKIASLAFNPHASHLTHGPAFRCPDHGYVTYPQGHDERCLARDACTRAPGQWIPVSIKDPAPALVIQDELHLLSEELGTFAAHYETLWQHLCAVGSGLPSKVLAATATISDYENQVRQLYALTPRRFPTDGWEDGESFYARRHGDLVRRVFVGALPTQMDVVQFAIAAGERGAQRGNPPGSPGSRHRGQDPRPGRHAPGRHRRAAVPVRAGMLLLQSQDPRRPGARLGRTGRA